MNATIKKLMLALVAAVLNFGTSASAALVRYDSQCAFIAAAPSLMTDSFAGLDTNGSCTELGTTVARTNMTITNAAAIEAVTSGRGAVGTMPNGGTFVIGNSSYTTTITFMTGYKAVGFDVFAEGTPRTVSGVVTLSDNTTATFTCDAAVPGTTPPTYLGFVSTTPGLTITTITSNAGNGFAFSNMSVGGVPGYVYVTDPPYNAVGDGIHDDTAAIQAALDAIGRGVLYLGHGTYKLTGTLYVKADLAGIIGDGATLDMTSLSTGCAMLVGCSGKYGPSTVQTLGFSGFNFAGANVPGVVAIQFGTLTNIHGIASDAVIVSPTFERVGYVNVDICHDYVTMTVDPKHIACDFKWCGSTNYMLRIRMGGATYGENFTYSRCAFRNGGKVLYQDFVASQFNFSQCTFEYCDMYFDVNAGWCMADNCSFEQSSDASPLFRTTTGGVVMRINNLMFTQTGARRTYPICWSGVAAGEGFWKPQTTQTGIHLRGGVIDFDVLENYPYFCGGPGPFSVKDVSASGYFMSPASSPGNALNATVLNLIGNGAFTSDLVGWTGAGSVSWDAAGGNGGGGAMKMVYDQPTKAYAEFPASGGDTVTANFDLYMAGVGNRCIAVSLIAYDINGAVRGNSFVNTPGRDLFTGSFAYRTAQTQYVNLPAGTVRVRLEFEYIGGPIGPTHITEIDNVVVNVLGASGGGGVGVIHMSPPPNPNHGKTNGGTPGTDHKKIVLALVGKSVGNADLTPAIAYVNVMAAPYNAAGDGIHDDAPAIQAAHDAIVARGTPGVLCLGHGNYKLGGPLYINADKVGIIGNGATLDMASLSTGYAMLVGSGGTGSSQPLVFSGFKFGGNNVAGVAAIQFGTLTDIHGIVSTAAIPPLTFKRVGYICVDICHKYVTQAANVKHIACEFEECGITNSVLLIQAGGTNYGNNLAYSLCTFRNGPRVLRQDYAASRFNFSQCTFDYNNLDLDVNAGQCIADNCYFEQCSDASPLFRTANNAVLTINNPLFSQTGARRAYPICWSGTAAGAGTGIHMQGGVINFESLFSTPYFCGGPGRFSIKDVSASGYCLSHAANPLNTLDTRLNNLCSNGAFASNLAGWTGLGSVSWDAAGGNGGGGAMKMVYDQPTKAYVEFPASGGDTVTANFDLYMSGVNDRGVTVSLIAYGINGAVLGNSFVNAPGRDLFTGSFAYLTPQARYCNLPAGTVKVRLEFEYICGPIGPTYITEIDNVVVTVLGASGSGL